MKNTQETGGPEPMKPKETTLTIIIQNERSSIKMLFRVRFFWRFRVSGLIFHIDQLVNLRKDEASSDGHNKGKE